MLSDRRQSSRFHVECPVTVSIVSRGHRQQTAKLRDIGERGARILMSEPLDVGTRLRLDVQLPGRKRGLATVCFEGAVTRVSRGAGCEVAVQFRSGGHFIRNGNGSSLEGSQPAGDWPRKAWVMGEEKAKMA